MSPNPVAKQDIEFEHEHRLSGGAIAGLSIGVILFVAFLVIFIIWYLRFRHYWASRKHTKMSNHVGSECGVPNGAHNNPYMSDPSDGPASSESWTTNGPGKQSSGFPNWWPTDPNQPQQYTTTSTPYPLPSAPWGEISEARIGPTRAMPVYSAVALGAANPGSYSYARDSFYGFETGDLSQIAPGMPGIYPHLSNLTSGEEPTTTTTSSNGKQSGARAMSQKMRSKVRMAARVSSLNMFNLRSKRRTSTRMHDSVRGRPKRRRGTRNSSVTIGSATVMGGQKFSMTPGEGYHNMNVISDSFEFNDLGSLDNDDFLCSLEKAVFPGLEGSQLSSSGTQSYRPSVIMESHAGNLSTTPNVMYPLSDLYSLTNADLSSGFGPTNTTWRPLAPELDQSSSSRSSQPIGFRFPAPGPPVSGWAHQLARFSVQETNTAPQTSSLNTPAPIRSPQTEPPVSSTAMIAIQPPPEAGASQTEQMRSSMRAQGAPLSAAIPRRRAQKRAKARQQSEPRTPVSRLDDDHTKSTTPTDPSADSQFRGSPEPLSPARPTQPVGILSETKDRGDSILPPGSDDHFCHLARHPLDRSADCNIDQRQSDYNQVIAAKTCEYERTEWLPVTGSSSSGTGRDSVDSTAAMLPAHGAKERSVSASRHPLLPPDSFDQSEKQKHRSPSFPDFFVVHANNGFASPYGTQVSPAVMLSTSPHLMWSDSSVKDHVVPRLHAGNQ